MTSREIRATVNRSSLGTKSARAARRSVSNERSQQIVASARAQWASKNSGPKKSGG